MGLLADGYCKDKGNRKLEDGVGRVREGGGTGEKDKEEVELIGNGEELTI